MKKAEDITAMDYKSVLDIHNKLYEQGFDVCKGCEFDRYASCHEGRVEHCKKQILKILDHPDEMKRPCWWEKNKN